MTNSIDEAAYVGDRMGHYIIDKNRNIFPATLADWAVSLESRENRIVCQEIVEKKRVSTVFLGVDYNIYYDFHHEEKESDKPLVFETMVFYVEGSIYCDRYATYAEAEEGHKKAVKWVKDGCKEEE